MITGHLKVDYFEIVGIPWSDHLVVATRPGIGAGLVFISAADYHRLRTDSLTSDSALSYWHWSLAEEMPWSELIRDPSFPHLPNVSIQQELIYQANQRVVRAEFLNFFRKMALGHKVSLEVFKQALSRLNVLLLTATGVYYTPTIGTRSYYPIDQPKEIIDMWIKNVVAGHYVNPSEPTN